MIRSVLTPEQISQLVTEVLGITPSAVTLMTFGHSSVSYDVALAERSLIVRTNTEPSVFAKTSANLVTLRKLGLPVPKVLTSDLTQASYPSAYMILEKIPGRDLRDELGTMTAAQKERLAEQIVNYQRRVATLPEGDGFGYAAIGDAARFPAWQELVISEIHKNLPDDLEPPLATLKDRVFVLIDAFALYLERVSPTCFLDDLTTKNVIVQNGELRGLIDFDVVCYGDPLWTLGLTACAVVFDLGPEHLDYVDALCRAYELDERARAVVTWYAALFGLTFLARASQGESANVSRTVDTLEGWLESLEH